MGRASARRCLWPGSGGSCPAGRGWPTSSVISARSSLRCLSVMSPFCHDRVEQDLDVDLVVGAVDAGRVVDGVHVDPAAPSAYSTRPRWVKPRLPALAHHPHPQLVAVDPDRVVRPVPDVGVALVAGLDVGADAAVPEQVHLGLEQGTDHLVRRQRSASDLEHLPHLGREGDRLGGARRTRRRPWRSGPRRSPPMSSAAARRAARARRSTSRGRGPGRGRCGGG